MKKSKKALIRILLVIFVASDLFVITSNASPIYIKARCAIAMDSKTGIVLFEQNGNFITPMASTTKIMTSLVAIKYGDLNKKVEISKNAASVRGSKVGYREKEQITIKELLYGLMLRSGNDAAIALAEGISGSVDEYMELMNEYAEEIGAVNSHFETPHGLDSQNHYCTAYDLALITCKAKEEDLFEKIVSSKDVDAGEYNFTRSYHNINKILYHIPNANGVKTGYTGGAGKCLVTSVNVNKSDIVFVLIDCPGRWGETSRMYDYCMKNYEYKEIAKKGTKLSEFVLDGEELVGFVAPTDVVVPIKKGMEVTFKAYSPSTIPKVINEGDKLGKLEIFQGEEKILDLPLEADKSYKKSKDKFLKNIMEKLKK
ncbi:D-alanyl-D-alanine carboxypeptidase family protein [Clostridium grantii]|uniref:serine-type D-Ala-D-Ala carboxypeptidase n=1 Tax=Clostridium grantii DSM 8605 TaxID=1121316 RepID=A0A1M5SAB8_9CLOT|nr:D-alanyl-D-alanine carboxypeptidase family protein [Clostridium grantii]SHH35454.1 D-alanyl-D-alanine carboxypeptidase [Clostridium grantii DSM 8605]